jgi:uncharacterized protein YjlB
MSASSPHRLQQLTCTDTAGPPVGAEYETPSETCYVRCTMEDAGFTHRREFCKRSAKVVVAFAVGGTAFNAASGSHELVQPEMMIFKDDGVIPNSRYPLLLFRNALRKSTAMSGSEVQNLFAANNWSNSWENGIYPFHHYHSTSHEVLGIVGGSASLRLGGEQGNTVEVRYGDVIVIPAGVGHKNIGASADFRVVGAYPDGRSWDLLTGKPGERPKADQNIAALPVPDTNPVYGTELPVKQFWS